MSVGIHLLIYSLDNPKAELSGCHKLAQKISTQLDFFIEDHA